MKQTIGAMNKCLKKCPSLHQIELRIIESFQKNILETELAHSLDLCHVCQRKFRKLFRYYRELDKQMKKAANPAIFEFVEEIVPDRIIIHSFKLKRDAKQLKNGEVFQIMPLDKNADFPAISQQENTIVLRMMHDLENKIGCFSISSPNPSWYRNVDMVFANSGITITTNQKGMGLFLLRYLIILQTEEHLIITPRKQS